MSEILVNKLTGTSTAGSILVTGEGNSTTTNLQQGLAKAWARYNASSGTPVVNDSLNVASMTDVSAGKHSYSFSTSFGNANYAFTIGGSDIGTDTRLLLNDGNAPATGSFQFVTINGSSAATDGTHNSTVFHGDLA